MDKKIAFFDTKQYDRDYFDEINKNYNFRIKYFEPHLGPDTAGLAKGFDGVCAFVNDSLDKVVINSLHENGIEVVALRCAGYNNVDFKSAYGRIHVLRVPAYSPYAVAEHAVALIMSLNRKIHKAYNRIRDGNFSIKAFVGFDMYGKTAGIIGTGKIGQCLISILKGFGMNVIAYDPFPDKGYAVSAGIEYVSLEILFKKSDIISLHSPLVRETEYMINKESIGMMKDGVMIINTSRGKLINTEALINGLKTGKIGSAGLDVYEEESEYFFEDLSSEMIKDDILARLITFPNVLITSHQAFLTVEALKNIASTTLDNFTEYFTGGYLKNEICYKCGKNCLKKENKRCF